jgi:hypothetical protein
MNLSLRVPDNRSMALDQIVQWVTGAVPRAAFDALVVDFVAAFSRQLLETPEARRSPELVALGFWTRRAALERLRLDFEALTSANVMRAPRGVVFHLPPANVDTMFVYSSVLSLLVGNRNIVRISQRRSWAIDLLQRALNAVLAEERFQPLQSSLVMLTYPHDEATTQRLSEAADVRVIWGGDETVRTIRRLPLQPHAKELMFPDRYSYAVLRAQALLALSTEDQRRVAERFFNDAYWFDQAGCASPRLVVWCGAAADVAEASERFFLQLAQVVASKGYSLDTGLVLRKLSFSFDAALRRPVRQVRRITNELTVVTLENLASFDRNHCGGGLFFEARIDHLDELVPFVDRKDQTLSQFGFGAAELRQLVGALRGRGLDRIVPVGEALTFNRYWDGYDLLQELTRGVHLVGTPLMEEAGP